MTEFIQSLGFWQWMGLIVLAGIVAEIPIRIFSRSCSCCRCPK